MWDEYLTGPFGLIAQYSLLKVKAAVGPEGGGGPSAAGPCHRWSPRFANALASAQEHEVEKMFTLKPGRLPQADVKNIIFFVRPKLELMDIITDNVLRYGGCEGSVVALLLGGGWCWWSLSCEGTGLA